MPFIYLNTIDYVLSLPVEHRLLVFIQDNTDITIARLTFLSTNAFKVIHWPDKRANRVIKKTDHYYTGHHKATYEDGDQRTPGKEI